jgi:type I restriction-modification system DNA methylase subunit
MTYSTAEEIGIDTKSHALLGCDYTPRELAISLAKKLKWDGERDIIDPACGSGNLLLACIEVYGEKVRSHLYGVDILPENIDYCKKNKELVGCHFKQGNTLEDDITSEYWWTGGRKPFKFGL